MATPGRESLVCARCYKERGPVMDLFVQRCFYPRESSHRNAPRLQISTLSAHMFPTISHRERQVRPVPANVSVSRFRLCKFSPPNTCRNGDLCTYAHSEEELKAWNRHTSVGKLPYPCSQMCYCVQRVYQWSYEWQPVCHSEFCIPHYSQVNISL